MGYIACIHIRIMHEETHRHIIFTVNKLERLSNPSMLFQFQVAWIKSDSKAILGIHTHMVSLNPRLSVTHNGHNTWKLHISHVQLNDSGSYMCQVNTDPMKSLVSQPSYLPTYLPNNLTSHLHHHLPLPLPNTIDRWPCSNPICE